MVMTARIGDYKEIRNVAVIGAGTMGNGIAHLFALHGHRVSLVDASASLLEKGMATIQRNMDRQVAKGVLSVEAKGRAWACLVPHTQTAEGVEAADLVIEAITEDMAQKEKLLATLDKQAPTHAIFASNTSSISITKLSRATRRPQQVIGMHFMNPVPIMKLVEVITGYATEKGVEAAIVSLSEALGKVPVVVQDYPGFVSNRILLPMINEAICALHESVAGVQAIDAVMKLGMGHPMGPLQLADFIGLDVCLSILRVLHKGFGRPKYAPCPLLVKMVDAGFLGVKSGEGFYDYEEGGKTMKASERLKTFYA